MKTLNDLVDFIYKKRFTEPELWWTKLRYRRRCTEIHVSEQVISRCMDQPLTDPIEIIDEYILELSGLDKSKTDVDLMITTLMILKKFMEG